MLSSGPTANTLSIPYESTRLNLVDRTSAEKLLSRQVHIRRADHRKTVIPRRLLLEKHPPPPRQDEERPGEFVPGSELDGDVIAQNT